jgi:hypothetical protein
VRGEGGKKGGGGVGLEGVDEEPKCIGHREATRLKA